MDTLQMLKGLEAQNQLLRRQNRLFGLTAVMALVVSGVFLLVGLAPQERKVVTATTFQLVDSKGIVRGEWGFAPLSLTNSSGNKFRKFKDTQDGKRNDPEACSYLIMFDKSGNNWLVSLDARSESGETAVSSREGVSGTGYPTHIAWSWPDGMKVQDPIGDTEMRSQNLKVYNYQQGYLFKATSAK